MAFPVLVLLLVTALWGIMLAARQVACVDAAGAGARAAARGESISAVREAVARGLPPGARVEVLRTGESTRVVVALPVRAPVPVGLSPVILRARAVAVTEPGAAEP
ncbi:hypothetical protein DPM19_14090 [Actinomadura craniellae]|uniref:Pilus assembly protein TadE n=1 Tax=Actinomadura craniellae TaxID=2231787 RepID=A0A365H7B2_9ACTN|nr:hypothetical protein DPM19_14090 [Actinomadura craniellae]